uniref:CCHC-type domain-containing protein n=1 Tax=Tanacetum cinerariifolium TaxID=118510 RepID=A0A6L2JVB6_TANCI|nr:hypothetical protein [Tanacetum cinerariifolium]
MLLSSRVTTVERLLLMKEFILIREEIKVQDYALWDVIENGNLFKPVAQTTKNDAGTSTTLIPGPITTEEKAQKKNDVKARSMLLMALPNQHLITFNQYKDAKTLFATIATRFGGNEATKKTQKTLIKQLYENFMLQLQSLLILSLTGFKRFLYMGTLKKIHKDDLEEMDLKWQLALLSMREKRFFQKTRKKITINGSDTAGFDKSKVKCYNCHKMGHFSKECRRPRNQDSRSWNQDGSRRNVNVEEMPLKAMVAIDGDGFDWSYIAEDKVPTNMALMAFSDSEINLSYSGLEEFQQPKFQSYGPKSCETESNNASKEIPNELKESPIALLVKNRVSNNKDCTVESLVVVEKTTVVPTVAKIEFVKAKQ